MTTPRNVFLAVLMFVVSIALWEGGVRGLEVPAFVLPAPSSVAMAFYRGVSSGLYIDHFWITLLETLLGFAVGASLGFCLGAAIALNRYVEYFLYPYVVMFQSLPKVALAPLIIVWFGLGLTSKVINAALIAFFPLMVNTVVGLRSADEDRINLMRALTATETQIFWKLRLPGSLPYLMAGIEIAMVFALIGAIVAEFVGAERGLGMLIQSMNFTLDVAGQFSVLFILAVLGLMLNRCVLYVRRRVLFWDVTEKAYTDRQLKGDAS